MPVTRCACPNCRRSFGVPDDVIGKKSQVPRLRGVALGPDHRRRDLAGPGRRLQHGADGTELPGRAAGPGTDLPPKEGEGEFIRIALTEDQRAAWRKVRKDNRDMPVHVVGCLHRSQGRQSSDDTRDAEDRWHFANQGRIFIEGPRLGEESVWAQGMSLGTDYYSPESRVKWEQTDAFRESEKEQLQVEEDIRKGRIAKDMIE